MSERIYLYDTTLRDGAQTAGIKFTANDKLAIVRILDQLGIDYIEAGWPGANPTDNEFFDRLPHTKHARVAAFGMTRRKGKCAASDPELAAILRPAVDVVTLVGKTSAAQVKSALGTSLDMNLQMIFESVAEASRRDKEVVFDAEQFFDGFCFDYGYAIACLKKAQSAGASWLVLCDTNGRRLPTEIGRCVDQTRNAIPEARIGIHTHNDIETAVAGTLAAVEAGARQVQGTLNGLGERCGNANLISLLPTLMLKMGFETGVDEDTLERLTEISRSFDDRLSRPHDHHAPYVGVNAFTHKAGLHASAVAKDPSFYEHIAPEKVGNQRTVPVSGQAGRSNLLANFAGLDIEFDDQQLKDVLRVVKEREAVGYSYELAPASLEILVRNLTGQRFVQFRLVRFELIDQQDCSNGDQAQADVMATAEIEVDGRLEIVRITGNDGIEAWDVSMRETLAKRHPSLARQRVYDVTIRPLASSIADQPRIQVVLNSEDLEGSRWRTIGLSTTWQTAACQAILDSLTYGALQA